MAGREPLSAEARALSEEMRRDFEETRREMAELAEDLIDAEQRVAALVRQDIQVGDLRDMLEKAREQHERLEARESALRRRFEAIVGGGSSATTH